jgi:hypothetical protein
MFINDYEGFQETLLESDREFNCLLLVAHGGADPHNGQVSDVLRLVLGQGVGLALFGVAIGVFAALVLTRFMASMVCEPHPHHCRFGRSQI